MKEHDQAATGANETINIPIEPQIPHHEYRWGLLDWP